MTTIQNETYLSMLQELGAESLDSAAFQILANVDHRFMRDLKINVQSSLKFENLTAKESALLAFACSLNEKNHKLVEIFKNKSIQEGSNEEELADMIAVVGLLRMNNVFYRFRHFVEKEYYNSTPAGLKMTAMGKPTTSKEFFELASLAISAMNGCETCVKSHEASVLHQGCTEARVYDAIRLSAIIRSFDAIVG